MDANVCCRDKQHMSNNSIERSWMYNETMCLFPFCFTYSGVFLSNNTRSVMKIMFQGEKVVLKVYNLTMRTLYPVKGFKIMLFKVNEKVLW